MDLQDIISKNTSDCIHAVSMSEYLTMISRELEILNEQQTLIFTDGSVVGCTVAWGACAVVLFPTHGREDNVQTATMAVGVKVSSEHCDIEGIIFGRTFVTHFALCYRTVVLSCLSVCL